MRTSLITEMRAAGCLECHGRNGQPFFFEEDWVNLQEPRWSRLLRAPLAKRGDDGMGQELCRNRPIEPNSQRVRLLCNGYAHAVQPPEQFPRRAFTKGDTSGKPFVTFNDEHNAHYQAMLRIICEARAIAVSSPRVDMPGASVVAGSSRLFVPPPVPSTSPPLSAVVHGDGTVQLQWLSPWDTIGLTAQLHRSDNPEFVPSEESLRVSGHVSEYLDHGAPAGIQHYKLVIADANSRSMPSEISVDVPVATAPPPPNNLSIVSSINSIHLAWQDVAWPFVAYRVYRRQTNQKAWTLVSDESLAQRNEFIDTSAEPNIEFEYIVRSISARGLESADSNRASGRNEVILEPVFATRFTQQPTGDLWPDKVVPGRLVTPANCENNQLDLRGGGHLTFEHQPHFDLQQPLSLECWIHVNQETQMPVYVSCGAWNQTGWFLQRLGKAWRWHVGGVDCDGGTPVTGRWTHVVATCTGQQLQLYQDGQLVAEKLAAINPGVWPGQLHIGQYSGQPGAGYQVNGRIASVRLYHRVLEVDEIEHLASTPPTP